MSNGSHASGMGCFARRATLCRVLRNALENYMLSKYEVICPAEQQILNEADATRFFRSVIRSGTERPDQIDRALKLEAASAKITGFYLGLNKEALQLVVIFQDLGQQQTKLIARLERFTRLREKRLH